MHITIGVIMALAGLIVICQGPKAVFRAALGAAAAGLLLLIAMMGAIAIMDQVDKARAPSLHTPALAEPTPEEVPMINYPIEYDRLPSGAAYTDASGKLKHKR